MLSTAKAEAICRDLKEKLEFRGFTVVESALADGRKLAIDSSMSIRIQAKDAVSKDIFGNSLKSFAPHSCKLAIDNDVVGIATDVAKVMLELAKVGLELQVGEDTTLGAAETAADTAEVLDYSVQWPTKGA